MEEKGLPTLKQFNDLKLNGEIEDPFHKCNCDIAIITHSLAMQSFITLLFMQVLNKGPLVSAQDTYVQIVNEDNGAMGVQEQMVSGVG